MDIEEIKNTLREFQAENGQTFKNTQADLKKVVSDIKKSVFLFLFEHVSSLIQVTGTVVINQRIARSLHF